MTDEALEQVRAMLERVGFDLSDKDGEAVLARVLVEDLPYRAAAAFLAGLYGGNAASRYHDVAGLDTEPMTGRVANLLSSLDTVGYDDWLFKHYRVHRRTESS